MKLPVVWMVAAFAAGIGLAGSWHAPSHTQLVAWGVAAAVAIALGSVFAWKERAAAGWALAIVAWVALGGLTTSIERTTVPANHCRFRRSTQHLLAVYSQEFQSLAFFSDVDSGAAQSG